MTFESPVTAVGLVRVVCVPSPSCPDAFAPHAQMVPSVFNAYVLLPPAAMATTPVIDEIHVGVDRVVVVPSPSWPNPFAPHVHTVPVSVNTTECAPPAAAAGPANATEASIKTNNAHETHTSTDFMDESFRSDRDAAP